MFMRSAMLCGFACTCAYVGILIYINTGSPARERVIRVGGDLQRIEIRRLNGQFLMRAEGDGPFSPTRVARSRSNEYVRSRRVPPLRAARERIESHISGEA